MIVVEEEEEKVEECSGVEKRIGGNSEKRYGKTKQIQASGELSIYKK